MVKIEAVSHGKNHVVVHVDGKELCTIYGKDWVKRFKQLKEAMQLHNLIITSDLKTINTVIKELRKK